MKNILLAVAKKKMKKLYLCKVAVALPGSQGRSLLIQPSASLLPDN